MDLCTNNMNRMLEYKNIYNKYAIKEDYIKIKKVIDDLHLRFNTITPNNKHELCKNILTEHKLNKILLKYEFRNYIPSSSNRNINEMNDYIVFLLNKYHQQVGKNKLEDDEWIKHTHKSTKYELSNNELIFENSILYKNKYCRKTDYFLSTLTNIMRNYASNFKTKFFYLSDQNPDILWVVIKIYPCT